MPTFGNYGKSGKPVPKCPHHDRSLATCTCKYARDWRQPGVTERDALVKYARAIYLGEQYLIAKAWKAIPEPTRKEIMR